MQFFYIWHMLKSITLKKVSLALIILIVVSQFFQIDKTNPPIDAAQDYIVVSNVPLPIQNTLKTACYDCHSHETAYPWYTSIAPVSWWVKQHINDGRKHLNFSIWGTYSAKKADHKLEECIEMLEEHEMPLDSYTWMHAEAKITTEQRQALVNWVKQQRAALN